MNLNTEDQPATSGQEQPGQSTLRELDSDVLYSKVTGLKTLVVLPKWRGAMRFGPVQQVAEDRLEVSKLAAIDAKARLIRLSRNDGRRVAEFTLTRLQSLAQQTFGAGAATGQASGWGSSRTRPAQCQIHPAKSRRRSGIARLRRCFAIFGRHAAAFRVAPHT
ncbi:hypothetical protein [Cypionkella sp. TWP1-2-1b2]|uniref:hypothetical protein n=1 Tax=Cypionkella sp. TWP1-2-1b2 TaxID=2804675 RepID=UPI003CF89FE2